MGKFSRDKGNRVERFVVNALQDAGFGAERVPLSGATHGRFGGDVSMPLGGKDLRGEIKCRAEGFANLYSWIEGADFLVLKADRKEPLVVLRGSSALSYAKLVEGLS